MVKENATNNLYQSFLTRIKSQVEKSLVFSLAIFVLASLHTGS